MTKTQVLKFKTCPDSIDVDIEGGFLSSQVLLISDLVSYEGENIHYLEKAFIDSINEDLDNYECLEIKLGKSLTGSIYPKLSRSI